MLGDVRRVTELEVRREAKGLSWTGLGVALGLAREDGSGFDVKTPKGWEERKHAPTRGVQKKLCAFLDVASIAELGLGCGLEAARYAAWMTEDERNAEVNRRRFCIVTGAALGACVLPVSKLVAGAQLLDGTRDVGAGELTFATEVATDLASRYAATPNAEVIAAAKAHAYTLLHLLKQASMTPGNRTRLLAIASDAACLVGYGYANAGRLAEANAWFADARKLARAAGDRRLEALALAASAWIPLNAPYPDHTEALTAFEAAAEYQGFLSPAGRAWVFGNLALERAALRDDLGSGRFLELARIAAALVPHDEPGWGWWSTDGDLAGWEDDARPNVYTGLRASRLGRPAEAVGLFDAALDGTTSPVRRALPHTDLTTACVALGDVDQTCASAMTALDQAKTHGVGIVAGKIRAARSTFPPAWSTLAPVIELDERLRLVA
ncbi:MAG: hypothetical protein ACRD0K_29380 [Egibacteraceae bacterium]